MTKNDNWRLCGGTFFCLLLQAKKQRKNDRPQRKDDDDGLSESDMLAALIKVFQSNYRVFNSDSLKTKTSNYKFCRHNSENNLPFSNIIDVNEFDIAIKNNYLNTAKRMETFVEKFIDENKLEWLVKSLLELINSDKKISANKNFFILPDGNTLTKTEIISTSKFFLIPFLTGVFHYILAEKIKNFVGSATIDDWYSQEERHKQRKFISNIGTNIQRRLEIVTSTKTDENVGYDSNVQSVNAELIVDNKAEQKNYSTSNTSSQKNVNKTFVFNFTQTGNNPTQIANVENFYNGRRE